MSRSSCGARHVIFKLSVLPFTTLDGSAERCRSVWGVGIGWVGVEDGRWGGGGGRDETRDVEF